ncbi:aminotransferase class I/II-fold pyridoxal phosphate-dependent enzyme [bacterium AH-315-F03]|nr:aminotransferase class I/II-fold pyridoxal phosphate-dependent enzyme [bacterium AH-315-F03]
MNKSEKQIVLQLQERLGVDENTITLYNSISDAIDFVAKTSLSSGGEALIAGPTVSNISEIAMQYADTVTLHLSSSAFTTDCSGLLDVITEKTKLVYLGAPNDPTGVVYSEKEVKTIVERAYNATVIVDETQLLVATQSFAQFAQHHSRLTVIKSIQEPGNSSAAICWYSVANTLNVTPMNVGADNRIDTSRLAQAIEILGNYQANENRVREIVENKTLVAMRLRSEGIEVRDTLSDKLMLEVAEPLTMQSALQSAGVNSRNCLGLPQLANWLVVSVADDKSGRVIIDTFESVPASYYQMATKESQDENNISPDEYSPSTLTIKRGAESKSTVAKRGESVTTHNANIAKNNISNMRTSQIIDASQEKSI